MDLENQKKTQERGILEAALFLWLYESSYCWCVNLLCFILIVNGHDLNNEFNNHYAETINDVENIGTSAKLRFLEAHKFEIMKRGEDREIRNAIAHQTYSTDGSTIKLKEKSKSIDLLNKIESLIDFCSDFIQHFNRCISEVYDVQDS